MRDLSGDTGVFIRSMATRGSLGGLAQATAGMVQVFDAAGFDIIMIETVGAGQSEVDIARLAHTTLVVEAPGMGDDIQAIKAGILEIADILVINKADRPGIENTEKALRSMLELAHPTGRVFKHHGIYMSDAQDLNDSGSDSSPAAVAPNDISFWLPPIQKTVSIDGKGIIELAEHIAKHAAHLRLSGDWAARERTRLGSEMEALLQEALMNQFREKVSGQKIDRIMSQVFERSLSPWEAVKHLTDNNGRAK
jgi:LAO/AO transport system kinase